jgi:hypothetical protein
MIRGVILTLGAIVTLASPTGARADDLSLFGWPALSPVETTGVFPRLPQNWNDLPVKFTFQEQVGYNNNIYNTPTGAGAYAYYGRPQGAMESISTYGVSFQSQVGTQQFSGDANFGMNRYLNYANFNTWHSSVDLGDNFTYGSKCTGSFRFSEATAPSLPGQQIGYNYINISTNLSLNQNLKCLINGDYSWVFNSGISQAGNSYIYDKVNNAQTAFISAGISYSDSVADNFQVLATVTGSDYTDRGAAGAIFLTGLSPNVTTDALNASYTRTFNPNFSLSASLGLVGVTTSYFNFAIPRTIVPQYTLSANWTVTPKISAGLSVSRSVSTPTAVVSNLQVSENVSANASYQWTPKISMSAGLSAGYSAGVATYAPIKLASGAIINSLYTANQNNYSASAGLSYTITPFVSATLSYQYTKLVQSSLTTNDSLILLAFNFNPY